MAAAKAKEKKAAGPKLGDAVWKDGYQPKADAKAVGQVLMRLAHQHGGAVDSLNPSIVVDEARHPDSPLHTLFTWDDAVAAEKRRIDEARFVLRTIRIIREGPTGEPFKAIAFVHARVDGENRYFPTQQAMSDEEIRNRVIRDARSLLMSAGERFRQLNMTTTAERVQAIADELDEGE
jgi:hypothetical protein